jgi:hypothetical protein
MHHNTKNSQTVLYDIDISGYSTQEINDNINKSYKDFVDTVGIFQSSSKDVSYDKKSIKKMKDLRLRKIFKEAAISDASDVIFLSATGSFEKKYRSGDKEVTVKYSSVHAIYDPNSAEILALSFQP